MKRRKKGFILLLTSLLLLVALNSPFAVFAADQEESNTEFSGIESGFSSFVYVCVVLLIIIGLIVVILRFLGKKNKMLFSHPGLRVVSAISLAQNKSLQLVEVGEKIYVLGVGDDISVIDTIASAEEKDQLLYLLESKQAETLSSKWSDWLNRMRSPKKDEKETMDHDDAASFQQVMMEKFNRISDQKQKLQDLLQEQEDNRKDRR
ncbi:flagellar biosynthetic protein FliO [Marinicrinis lubricantis]|uniref:Flagellar protein n=1 Tax=Marinicrinis lubricantis TaxID=2086470 RepID=A0ABW1IMJ8_9BACL